MSVDKDLLKVNELNIWNHQKDALKSIANYLNEYDGRAHLVKMPTGTGKTGVFACLTRILYPERSYIIITPSSALKFQIINELSTDFWTKIKISEKDLPNQEIIELMPSDADEVVENITGKKYIIITTIQSLQMISIGVKYQASFQYLKDNTDCLIFDEGHKEPSYTWSETVRSFKKPTILFSATPYRNDYKVFNINKEKFYSLEHKFCVDHNILRTLQIAELKADPLTPSTFLTELLSQINKLQPSLTSQGIINLKVIIRCSEPGEIKKIVAALVRLKKRVVGIHDTFDNKAGLLTSVPEKDQQAKYDFFVHQYKLIEGIDNPDFVVLALYSNFESTRLLIQQVGRVLRNPELKPNQFAYLFAVHGNRVKSEWEKYLQFDTEINTTKKLFDIADVLRVNKDVSKIYFSGTFRDLVDVNNIELAKKILFQKKINVFAYVEPVLFNELTTYIIENWERRDYFILKHEIHDNNAFLILYIQYENSPLVKEGIFIEQKLAISYVSVHKDFVFYYDSELNNPFFQHEKLVPVTREVLINLYNRKRSITKVLLHNTDIGKQNLRSKEILAGSIEATAPGLADHSYFPARIEGYVDQDGEKQRRYVGFQFGRVTDSSAKRISFEEFQVWVDKIRNQLSTVTAGNGMQAFLKRFSTKVDPPADTTPASILLDLDDTILEQYIYGDSATDLSIAELCFSLTTNQFILEVNGVKFDILIEYSNKRKRYNLSCSALDKEIKNIDENGLSFLAAINLAQCFRVVVKGNQYVYAYNNFYKPGLNLISRKKELDLTQLFHSHNCISKIKSEKGSMLLPTDGTLWHRDALFGIISRRAIGYEDAELERAFSFDHMVCDDLSSEIADFIALDTVSKRLVLMHVKAGDAILSASAFQEVCGQATKNLDYLTPYYLSNPDNNIERWDEKWTHSSIGKANRTIIGGPSKTFWSTYTKLISDPSVNREVWLVVGNMFDYDNFKKEINKNKIESIKPELIQLIYLLRSTWDSVSSMGAQLKIFC